MQGDSQFGFQISGWIAKEIGGVQVRDEELVFSAQALHSRRDPGLEPIRDDCLDLQYVIKCTIADLDFGTPVACGIFGTGSKGKAVHALRVLSLYVFKDQLISGIEYLTGSGMVFGEGIVLMARNDRDIDFVPRTVHAAFRCR